MKIFVSAVVLIASLFVMSCSSHHLIVEPTRSWQPPSPETAAMIEKGVTAYDHQKYDEAVTIYEQALKTDSNSVDVMYELAMTYSALKAHQKSFDLCTKAMEFNYPDLNRVYALAGTELDMMGKPKDAVDLYEEGLDRFPQDHMLHYNLGITYLGMKKNEKARSAFKSAVTYGPQHASSHYALAASFASDGFTIPALLAYSRFLVLESGTKRADIARENIRTILGLGVRKDPSKDNHINITIDMNAPKDEGDFTTITLLLSMQAALGMDAKQAKKSDNEKLTETFDGMFSMMGEMMQRDKPKGFAWEYYVPYFADMKSQNHIPAFVNLAFSKGSSTSDSARAFLRWSGHFKWTQTAAD